MTIDAAGAPAIVDRIPARIAAAVLAVVLLGGAWVRVAHWAHGHSLWVDELRVAVNVAERPLARLLAEPLLYVARVPAGHLVLERSLFRAFGRDERALRLPGLVGSLAGLLAAALMARRLLGPRVAPLPVALLAFGAPMVAFAADVRPYAWDAAAALLAPWLASRWREQPDARRTAALGAALLLLPWLSFGAGLACAGVALVLPLVALGKERRAPIASILGAATAGAAGFAGSVALAWWPARGDTTGLAALDDYWSAAGGFPPRGAGLGELAAWGAARVAEISEFAFRPVTLGWPGLAVLAIVAAGAAALVAVRGWRVALLVVAPLLASLGAGLLRGFPVSNRLALAAAPAAALLAGALLAWLDRRSVAGSRLAVVLAVALAVPWLLVAPALAAMPAEQAGRELVAAAAREMRAGDRLYVFYSGEPAFRFYSPLHALDPGAILVADCERWVEQLDAEPILDASAGTRLWVLSSNAFADEHRYLDARLRASATGVRGFEPGSGRRRVERLDLYRFGAPAAAPEAGPPPLAGRWRCAFFERS